MVSHWLRLLLHDMDNYVSVGTECCGASAMTVKFVRVFSSFSRSSGMGSGQTTLVTRASTAHSFRDWL